MGQKFEGGNGVSHTLLGNSFTNRGNSQCKTVRTGPVIPCVAIAVNDQGGIGGRGEVDWLEEEVRKIRAAW